MPNIIDKQQLQATAQVAKSYILEQDTANIGTIINALQQSGSSTPAGLLDPNIRWGQVLIGGEEYEGYTWDGNGDAFIFSVHNGGSEQIDFEWYDKGDTPVIYERSNFILVKSDGTYATSWKRFDY